MTDTEREVKELESGMRIFAWIVILIMVISGGAMIFLNTIETKKKFMSECRKDHKQYECDALWGQARWP